MPESKRIHMIAICGTGMAALAGLLQKAGHRVTGSDTQIYPPMSLLLQEAAIPCLNGYDPNHIDPRTDLVIVGNAVGKTNPEAAATLERGLPYLSMPAALSEFFLKEKRSLVVAGTHGKTTTSSLLAWVLTSAGLDPGAMIGGWVKNFNSNHRLGKGSFFVVEGDEYDTSFFDKGPKFLHYRPHDAILTGVEFDHGDIYPDLAAIKEAFRKLVRLIPADGLLVAAAGDAAISEVTEGASCAIETYGIKRLEAERLIERPEAERLIERPGAERLVDEEADWRAGKIEVQEGETRFEVERRGEKIGSIRSPLIGRHNVKNTLAVIALASRLGVPWEKIQEGVRRFEGVKRRQEVVAQVRDILIVDDFAHHPTAIAETLAALRLRYPGRRLWAVFEPRSATSRRNIFQKEFTSALARADRIVLADIFAPEKLPPESRLDPRRIVSDLAARGKEAFFVPAADRIAEILLERLAPGDVVCVMSSGGFGGLHQKLIEGLSKKR